MKDHPPLQLLNLDGAKSTAVHAERICTEDEDFFTARQYVIDPFNQNTKRRSLEHDDISALYWT